MSQLLMSIDIGTTSTKCIVMNYLGEVKASSSNGYSIINRSNSWVEQDPLDWWRAAVKSIKTCLEKIDAESIQSISFSGHMSAPVFLDKEGATIYPSILISDTRSNKQSSYLRKNYFKAFVEMTGNEPVDAFTVSKLLWMQDKESGILKETDKFIFPKDFVRFKMTNRIGTDPTDAGNSLLFKNNEEQWNWSFIHELGLPRHIFPEIVKSNVIFGAVSENAAKLTGLLEGTPVITGAADMACSQIGTGAINRGTLAITLGTSGQVVMNVPERGKEGIGEVTYHTGAIENSLYVMGTIFTAGLGVEWGYKRLFNKQKMEKHDYQELDKVTEEMVKHPPGSNGLLFLPFLVGSSTPYYDTQDRAAWIGLSLHQEKSLMLHSILEGIAFNILENVNVMKDIGFGIEKVHLGAGGSRNKVWCKIIADVLGQNVELLENRDASALGAAILGGVGVGMFKSINEAVESIVKTNEKILYDKSNFEVYQKLFKGYQEIYSTVNRYFHSYY